MTENRAKGKEREQTAKSEEETQEDTGSGQDDWSHVTDPLERRKIQNRLAQRKFREKSKQRKETAERQTTNERLAGSAYATPEPEELDEQKDLSGVPWGALSMGHVVRQGSAKKKEDTSRHASREASIASASRSTHNTGRGQGTSGLVLV